MTEPGVQLLAALAFAFALAAFGVACALWWRINHLDDDAPAPPAPVVGPPTPPIPPPPPPKPKPHPPTNPTIPIADAIDAELARFNIPGRTHR